MLLLTPFPPQSKCLNCKDDEGEEVGKRRRTRRKRRRRRSCLFINSVTDLQRGAPFPPTKPPHLLVATFASRCQIFSSDKPSFLKSEFMYIKLKNSCQAGPKGPKLAQRLLPRSRRLQVGPGGASRLLVSNN